MSRRLGLGWLLLFHVASHAQGPDAVALHARAGAAAMAARNWEAAEREYRVALQIEPGIAELASNLGLALYFQGKYDAAAEGFEQALSREPQLFVPNLLLGRLRIEHGQALQAVPYLEQSVLLQPKNALARRLLAQGLVGIGDHQRALEQLREAGVLEPNDTEVFYSLSKVSMELARIWMEKAISHPVEGRNYQNLILARRFQELGAWQAAKTYYVALREANANLPGIAVALELARIAEAQKERQTEAERLEQKGATVPASPDAKSRQDALALFEAGQTDQAATRFRELLRASSDDANAAYWLGRCYERMTREALQRMVEIQPDSHRVHQLTAELALEQERPADAIAEYTKALARKPEDSALVLGLGQAYMKDGQPDAAIAQFLRVLARDARNAAACLNIARCYLVLKDARRAYEHARRAIEIDAKMLTAHGVMGKALAMEDRTAEAVAELEKAAQLDRDGSVHYQIFLAYRKLHDPTKAQAALLRFQERRSKNKRDYLEEVQIQMGKGSPGADRQP